MNTNIVDKIQKLLALAGNNPNENEAKAALLKAQELMAQYNVDMDGLNQEASITYKLAETKVKAHQLRNALGHIIANSFACKVIIYNGKISFFGREDNALACASAFEFAFRFMHKNGKKAVRDAGFTPHRAGAANVYNAYAMGFLKGIKGYMDAQTVALAVVVPEDVKTEFSARFNTRAYQSRGVSKPRGSSAYESGFKDGSTVMDRRSLQA